MNKKLCMFACAVGLQFIILAAVPAQKSFTLMTGNTVRLRTEPVDPYSIMSGYYVTLNYKISRLPDKIGNISNKERVYVILEEDKDDPLKAWTACSIEKAFPDKLKPGQVVIKGTYNGWSIRYGIETYFIPEEKREAIERNLRDNNDKTIVKIKVDRWGNAAIDCLIIGKKVYHY